jgi:hypothetical protein
MTNFIIVRCQRPQTVDSSYEVKRDVIITLSTHLGKMAIMKSARNQQDRTDKIYINDLMFLE